MLRKFPPSLALIFTFLFLHAVPAHPQQTDLTFGNNGVVYTSFPNPGGGASKERAVKVFYLPDGKLLAVAHQREGFFKSPARDTTHLFRYLNNGSLDTSASPTGIIGSHGNFVAADAARQPDGKIVVAGYTFQNPQMQQGHDWKIVRFNADGSLDSTFGTNGIIVRGFGANRDFATNVELQPDGKIVVSGYSSTQATGGVTVTVVARYNANGSPDAAFGPYGEGFFDIYDNGYLSKELIIQPDGKILAAGDSAFSSPGAGDVFLARFNSNGAVDTTFGSGGYVTLSYSAREILDDVELQPDGKILVLLDSIFRVPGATDQVEQLSVLARFQVNGAKDLSFGSGGEVFINTAPPTWENQFGALSGYENAQSIALRSSNGNILISGVRYDLLFSSGYMFSILQYSANGQFISKNFSRRTRSNQLVLTYQPAIIEGSFEQPDGKILLYGADGDIYYNDLALVRYLSVSAVNNANNFFNYDHYMNDEIAVYRPNNSGLGTWFFRTAFNQLFERQYGAADDQIAPGDYDGDGYQDLAVFRPATGEWITRKIYLNACAPMDCVETVQFGANGDIPAPGDYDGDGKFDRAVFRPSGGDWYILFSSTGGYTGFHFGRNGDKPVTGDYDGDGKSDAAVIRRENGFIYWYIQQSSDGQFVALQFGITEDKAVVADYNGDGRTEIAVWRPSNGTWYVLTDYTAFSYVQFGATGDIPEPFDYDGDRKPDFAVFRPDGGVHYILKTSNGQSVGVQFGANGDIPIASAYVR
ncbi:MAG: FG-GAP-like repeat-containing protein [Acidobacteriota bacterium]|nr:FG-GAP-like repeat-containing protein [Acidobacteriota bacterium]